MQRRATANTRGPNAAEKHYVGWIKEHCRCAACGAHCPVIAHHCEGATFRHDKTLVGHWFVIGLCQTCDDVVTRGSRKAFRLQFGPQSKLWAKQVFAYELETLRRPPPEVSAAILAWGR